MTFVQRAADILVVSAFDPELAPLRSVLGDELRARVGTLVVAARAVGIGMPDAAGGAARTLAEAAPRALVLLGTCGAYAGTGLAVESVVAARRVVLADALALAGAAQYPGAMCTAIDCDPALVAGVAASGAEAADVAATLAITVDDGAAAFVRQGTGASIEHLEAYAVAAACLRAGVPFVAALGVANVVGARAREEWRAHQQAASAAAARVVVDWLRAGAPGAPGPE